MNPSRYVKITVALFRSLKDELATALLASGACSLGAILHFQNIPTRSPRFCRRSGFRENPFFVELEKGASFGMDEPPPD